MEKTNKTELEILTALTLVQGYLLRENPSLADLLNSIKKNLQDNYFKIMKDGRK